MREVRAGPAQDVTRTGSEDHIGGDVAMGRETMQMKTVRGQTAGGGPQ